jgi:hypothetical protein
VRGMDASLPKKFSDGRARRSSVMEGFEGSFLRVGAGPGHLQDSIHWPDDLEQCGGTLIAPRYLQFWGGGKISKCSKFDSFRTPPPPGDL